MRYALAGAGQYAPTFDREKILAEILRKKVRAHLDDAAIVAVAP
jgi:hypothetical protein